MTNSREIAAHILTDIYLNFQFLENLLSKNRDFNRLDYRDKAFVRLIILNTLRRNGQIQAIIDEFIRKPLKKKDAFILNLIRISICQILFLNIKEYSVVNTAVQISKNYNRDKFVNGVLRNICRNKTAILNKTNVESNIPNWIKKNILESFGQKQLIRIAKNISKEPLVDIKIKKDQCVAKNWEKILNGKFINSEVIRLKNDGPIDKKPFFDRGFWWVQSLSATLPVNIISSIFKESQNSGISVLDIGVGSGCLLISILKERKNFYGTGIDINKNCLNISKINAKMLNVDNRIKFYKTDVDKFVLGKYDLIVSNPPYIKKYKIKYLERDVAKFEPTLALDGGLDGLSEIRKVILKSSELIKKNGKFILEIGFNQKNKIIKLLKEKGFYINSVSKDLSKNDRCIVSTKI